MRDMTRSSWVAVSHITVAFLVVSCCNLLPARAEDSPPKGSAPDNSPASNPPLFAADQPPAGQPATPIPPAQPPTTPPPPTAEKPVKLKPMVVTGSNIPTLEESPVAPVTVIDRQQIERSGADTVTDLLRRLPESNGNQSFQDNQASSFTPGSASVSLRALGPQRTLVLLNGRRIAPYPFADNFGGLQSTFVDLNSIPLGAVERVEILQDSGSALYGSDAIAGVVNIILRQDYTGMELTSAYGDTTHKDLSEQSHTFVAGLHNEKMNMMLFLDYMKRNSQFLRDRDVSSVGFISSVAPVGSVFDPNPASPTFGERFYIPPSSTGLVTPGYLLTTRPPENRFNTNPLIVDWPSTERYGGYSVFNYDLTDFMTFFLEGGYRKVKTEYSVNPTPIFGDTDGFTIGPNNPYNPYPGYATPFRWRAMQAGSRIDDIDTDVFRILPGLRFRIGEDWQVETAYLYNWAQTTDNGQNYLSSAALQAALNDSNPTTALNTTGGVGFQNNPATINGLKVRTVRQGTFEYWSYDVKAYGKLYDLPAGPLGIALGGETSYASLSDIPDALSQQPGAIVGTGGNQASTGSRDADALYAELAIPIFSKENAKPGLRSLELQVAGRFEYYSDFGTTEKPRLGLKWQPIESVLLRASYSQGFRAPALSELFQAESIGFLQGIKDMPRCNAGLPPDDPDCTGDTEFKVITGGNPNLKPENSTSYYVGGSYQPPFIKGLTLSADFIRIVVKNVISVQDPQFIVLNPGLFPGAVVRGTPQFPGDPGPIISITSIPVNINEQDVDSVDFGASYLLNTASAGDFAFSVNGTYFMSFTEKSPDAGTVQLAGGGSFPRTRATANVFWTGPKGSWSEKLTMGPTVNYISSFHDTLDPQSTVSAWYTVDLQATYQAPYDTTVTLGVLNVGDVDAPASDLSEGYDNTVHDNRGRFIYARFTKKF